MTERELLELITEMAPRLRAQGLRSVALGSVRFTLEPAIPDAPRVEDEDPIIEDLNVLDDPVTYGRRKGKAPFTIARSKT